MKKLLSIVLVLAMAAVFCSCGEAKQTAAPKQKTDINVFMIAGPTGMGAADLMGKAESGTTGENYHFTVVTTPDEIVSKISTGEADIAAVATNLAAKLYAKTQGKITLLAVNTLGVLNVMTNNGDEITSMADLKGKTVYTTGKGANPEYIINYLLTKNGLDPEKDVNLQYKTEGTDLVPVWATEPDAVIIAPQPVASAIGAKYQSSKIALDLTDEWEKTGDNSALMMGCVIVRNEFLENNPEAVETFLDEYNSSVSTALENSDSTAALCEKYKITASAAIAKKAMPNCNLCYVTGEEMKTKLSGYLQILFDADPSSVGGKLPDNSFYYAK